MILAEVMDALAGALDGVGGLRGYGWPVDTVTPPAGIVGYPELIAFDATYQRGSDTWTVPVWVVVGKASTRAARDALSAFVAGSGARSVKAALEAGPYTVLDDVHVVSAEPDLYSLAGVEYLAAKFTVNIIGTGA